MKPLLLPPNQFHRFYRGGARIDALRGVPEGEDGRPEDWVGSTATSFGSDTEGLQPARGRPRCCATRSRPTPRATSAPTTSSASAPTPRCWSSCSTPAQRLPVHFHPGRAFAREHLGMRFGKTESWIILEAEPDAAVHVGPREPLDAATVRGWVRRQDADEMLAALQRVPVAAGDAVLVPAGTLHAIGAGILLLELQEPTDLSVLVEWKPFGVDDGSEHLELGWETALQAMDTRARRHRRADRPAATREPAAGRRRPLLPRRARPRRRRARASFAVVLVYSAARARCARATATSLRCAAARPCSCRTAPARRHCRVTSRRSGACHPCRPPERGTGERAAAAGGAQDRQVVRARAGADAARTSPSSRARSSRWWATTARASRTLVKTLVGVHPADSGEILFEGRAGRHPDAPAGARHRDRDRLPGPRAGGRDRPGREHVPRPRDPARRPARQARLPRQAGDAQAQRGGLPQPRRAHPGHRRAPVANMSGGQRQGIAISRAVTWAEQGRLHGRADRGARRRADPQRARADQAGARAGPVDRADQPQPARRSSRSPTASRCCGSASASRGCGRRTSRWRTSCRR